jgi:hypothetical protein
MLQVIMPGFAFAHEQTLIKGNVVQGGFGALVLKGTEITNKWGLMLGARGGWIINHTFSVGAGGYWLVSSIKTGKYSPMGKAMYMEMIYGGGEIQYINKSDKLLHFTIYTLLGVGFAGYNTFRSDYPDYASYHNEDSQLDGDAFFVVEPTIDFVLNIIQHFRTGLSAGYRFVRAYKYDTLKSRDLCGPSFCFSLQFGLF